MLVFYVSGVRFQVSAKRKIDAETHICFEIEPDNRVITFCLLFDIEVPRLIFYSISLNERDPAGELKIWNHLFTLSVLADFEKNLTVLL